MIKKKEQIESEIGETLGKFLKTQMGENTENVITNINKDTVFVRFKGALSPAERSLMQDFERAKSIKELKEKLIENIKPKLGNIIKELINVKVKNIHSDIDTGTGERIIIFTVDENLEEKFKRNEE